MAIIMDEPSKVREPFAEMETLQFDTPLQQPGPTRRRDESEDVDSRDVAFSSIRLVPGIALQVSPLDNQKDRLNSKLIGVYEGKSLIITTPQAAGTVVPVRDGQKFLLRTFFGNSIFVFVASVLKSNLTPYPYVHLNYPANAKAKTVRRATRVSTTLIATANNLNSEINQNCSCRIIDLSTNGAMLVARHPIAAMGDRLMLNFRLRSEAGEHYISANGTVRTANPADGEGVRYGLEFAELEQGQLLVVENFIYRTLMDE